jgi:hypothetical protein
MADQRIAKWRRWMDGPIKASVITMNHHRQIWRGVAEIIEAHGSLPDSAYWDYYVKIYAETQAMAVRRQADLHPDVASLAKLLSDVAGDAKRLAPEWWVGLWNIDEEDDYERTYARGQWDAEYGGKIGVHLDPAIPANDLYRLIEGSEKVKKYVDKHIAHSEDPGPAPKDPGPTPAEATLYVSDVHDAIDLINEVFERYYRLFEAASMITLEPVIQHDWKAVFREPWVPSGTS